MLLHPCRDLSAQCPRPRAVATDRGTGQKRPVMTVSPALSPCPKRTVSPCPKRTVRSTNQHRAAFCRPRSPPERGDRAGDRPIIQQPKAVACRHRMSPCVPIFQRWNRGLRRHDLWICPTQQPTTRPWHRARPGRRGLFRPFGAHSPTCLSAPPARNRPGRRAKRGRASNTRRVLCPWAARSHHPRHRETWCHPPGRSRPRPRQG